MGGGAGFVRSVTLGGGKQRGRRAARSRLFCSELEEVVIAHYEAAGFLETRKFVKKKKSAELPALLEGPFSIDVGLGKVDRITVDDDGVGIENPSIKLTWKDLESMTKRGKSGAYECSRDGWRKISDFSETTQRAISLLPVRQGVAPTVVVGGFGMHRIKSSDPTEDTKLKMKALGAPSGNALDICTGLGYTAIALSEKPSIEKVTTIELDPTIVSIQERNPWSRALFQSDKIERLVGDAVVLLPSFRENSFSLVVHDPPALALSDELYTLEFYRDIRRVLKNGGLLFHYIGDPSSKESGRLFRGVMERLRDAGFSSVQKADAAFGVTAR